MSNKRIYGKNLREEHKVYISNWNNLFKNNSLDILCLVQWFFSISSSSSLAAVVFWNQKQLITIGRFWVWTQTQTWKLTKWATSSFLRLKCITQNIINEIIQEKFSLFIYGNHTWRQFRLRNCWIKINSKNIVISCDIDDFKASKFDRTKKSIINIENMLNEMNWLVILFQCYLIVW